MSPLTPFGAWKSPLSADLVTGQTLGLSQPLIDGEDIYWIEARPSEAGRSVIVKQDAAGVIADMLPAPFNARSRVHEYGGGAYAVHGGLIFFSNFSDNRIYRLWPGELPVPLTPKSPFRFADMVIDLRRRRLICVREDHTSTGFEAVNALVEVDMEESGKVKDLISGNDFYASPRVSPEGNHLAYLTWSHPNMPWDGCELRVVELNRRGTVSASVLVAGGPRESIFQPEWSPAGDLFFVSDRSGYWNLYRWSKGKISPLLPSAADFGQPQWVFGFSTFAFAGPEKLICAYCEKGLWKLGLLTLTDSSLKTFDLPYTVVNFVKSSETRSLFLSGAPGESLSIAKLDLASEKTAALRRSMSWELDKDFLSQPETLAFPSAGGHTAHAFFYPPRNRDYSAKPSERPPLLIHCHGGPTGAASAILNPSLQFWTSRGFGVLDLNYAGSSGFGRAYRDALNGAWGEADVDDAVFAARYLAERGDVDPSRMAIRGGSAGGYTALAALTFRDTFKAGAIYFGISDLEAMAKDTHKFESRYLDRLIGPYPAQRDLYLARSPIHHLDRMNTPAIFFQGLDDKVVPPNQSEKMVEALRKKGLPVEYLAFEGEGHGFRKAENLRRSLEAELKFYGKIFGFEPAA